MAPKPPPVAIGQVIARKYRVERVLGEGGMGIVVAAHHEQLHQRVALKLLLPEVAANAEAVARFAREARAAVRIQSEHVARVIDVGELDDGAPYMVMEYLEGSDLSAVLAGDQRPTPQQAVEYVLQACEAIAEAHAAGIVHRDLKPANLFVTRRADGTPLVKVLDFGISKVGLGGDVADAALTKTTAFMGSPMYVSPEQLMSTRSVDVRSDIWALGIILYEALAGEPPFNGESVMEIASRILQQPARPLHELRAELPPGLCDVVMRCLEKKVDERFANVGELARALGPFAPAAQVSVDRISRVVTGARSMTGAEIAATVAAVDSPVASRVTPSAASPAAAARAPIGSTQRAWGDEHDPAQSAAPPHGSARRGRWLAVVLAAIVLTASVATMVAVAGRREATTPVSSAGGSGVASGSGTTSAPGVADGSAPVASLALPTIDPTSSAAAAPPVQSASSGRPPSALAPSKTTPAPNATSTARPAPTASVAAPPQQAPTPSPTPAPAPTNPLEVKLK